LLVKLKPKINTGTVEGQDEYELPLDLDYKYTVKKEKIICSTFVGSKILKVTCSASTNDCEEFNIIYDANLTKNGEIELEIDVRLDNWNKNLIKSFDVKVICLIY
jgi:hypothetical protein